MVVSITIKSFLITLLIIVTVNAKSDITKCLEKESLTCLQTYAYRQIREISTQPSIQLIGGIELVKNVANIETSRSASEIDAEILDSEETGNFEKREILLEQFLADKTIQFMSERSLRWNSPLAGVSTVVRNLSSSVRSIVVEGRGKKILKALLPLVLGLKLKVVGFLLLSYLAIALLAKQAMVAAVISLAISLISAVRAYLAKKHPHYSEHHLGLGAATPIFPTFGHVGYDLTDWSALSSAYAHNLPYAAYKPLASRR